MPDIDANNPLRPITAAWCEKIKLCRAAKKEKFQDDADEAMRFFNGPYDFLYGSQYAQKSKGFVFSGSDEDLPRPAYAMTVNKVAELVQIFGPALYHRNPVRQVNPRKPPLLDIDAFGNQADPNVQMGYQQLAMQVIQERAVDRARATLMEHYLNYTPAALDLKSESRRAIDEALIKGCGIVVTEVYQPPGSPFKMVGSFFRTVDDLIVDMDFESMQDAKWIAIRCVHPYWQVEAEYGLPPGCLKDKTSQESYDQQSAVNVDRDGDYHRRRGATNDLVVYYKLYSKMGLGAKLTGVRPDMQPLDQFGDYVYLVVAENIPWPLNLHPQVIETATPEEVMERVQWPTPFWRDDSWPFTPLIFHDIPREVWPQSHIKPAMGELKFINWAYSMLASKVRVACRDFIAIAKSTGEELKNQIQHGQDYTIIEVENIHGAIDQVVKFLQHPNFNTDVYKVIEGVTANFEKRTGLTELAYGMTTNQMRSAEEANVKGEQMAIRPDDMANKVEDWMSDVARKEALAVRWHLGPQDVLPIMGPVGAQWWQQFVMTSDPSEIIHQLEYRIEAGSVKKPNRARELANMQQAMQTLFAPLFSYAQMTGNIGPINALITGWAKSMDLDATAFLLQTPPPPPPPTQSQQKAAGSANGHAQVPVRRSA